MATRQLSTDSLYAVLGVPENAGSDLIDERYRALAKLFHPDRNPDDAHAEERFKRISEANRVLSDPDRRAAYDARRRRSTPTTVARPPAPRPAVRPAVRPGRGVPRRVVPAWLRLSVAWTLIVGGVAVMLWRLVARDGADAATDITLWIVGIKLAAVGAVVLFLPAIRAAWERASAGG